MARKAESYEFAKYLEEAISEYGSTIGDDALVEKEIHPSQAILWVQFDSGKSYKVTVDVL
ncbi:MAG: hypothetical protein WC346_15175 [Methanogenium sp.]|jgi:hypothetical protein